MTTPPEPRTEVRRAGDRALTRTPELQSRHSFSFGPHYDPGNTSFGLLVAVNEDRVAAGAGFPDHPHRDLEIVTWVLDGALVHEDSTGGSAVTRPGQVQVLGAGRGVRHAETNDPWRLDGGPASDEPVRYVQTWLVPDTSGLDPVYDRRDVRAELATGALVPVASGRPGHAGVLRLRQRHAALHAARLPAGSAVELPDAPYLHLFVARGEVVLEGVGRLGEGDAARLTASGGRVSAPSAAEVLVWEMHAGLG